MNCQMDKDKHKQEVSDHDGEPYEKAEKMKRSPLESCEVDVEPMADEVTAQNPAPARRECDLCCKTFSNGKALGGHRRSHFQAAKGHPQKVKTRFSNHSKTSHNKANCDEDDTLVSDGKHTCYLCKKDFPSKNALFGHMRSHPERDWRGICPPTHSDKHSSSCSHNSDSMEQNKEDHDDDCVAKVVAPNEPPAIDLSKSSLPTWKKTDKRGRRSIGGYEAAENLVYISRWEYFCAESMVHLKEAAVEPESPEAPIPCKEKHIPESSTREKHAVKKIKFYLSGSLNLGLGNKNEGDGDFDSDKVNRGKGLSESGDEKTLENMDGKEEEDADWAKEKYCVKNMYETSDSMNTEEIPVRLQDHVGHFDERKEIKKKKGKKIKKLLLKPKTQDSKSEDKSFLNKTQKKLDGYECDICWKSFSTFQALGGHKWIHNKEKNIIAMDELKPSNAMLAEDKSCPCPSHLFGMNETKNTHVRGPVMEAANKVGTETLVGTPEALASQSVGPKILDIDLNVPCDMQD